MKSGFLTSNRTGSLTDKSATCCNDIYQFTFPEQDTVDTIPENPYESLEELNKYLLLVFISITMSLIPKQEIPLLISTTWPLSMPILCLFQNINPNMPKDLHHRTRQKHVRTLIILFWTLLIRC